MRTRLALHLLGGTLGLRPQPLVCDLVRVRVGVRVGARGGDRARARARVRVRVRVRVRIRIRVRGRVCVTIQCVLPSR